MRRCILFAPRTHRLFDAAIQSIASVLSIRAVVDDATSENQFSIEDEPADLVISFLNSIIIKSRLLERENVNFHPAPAEYPGRGGASLALFDGAKTYGATAHRMAVKVDAGPIYDVVRFPIYPEDTCETLFMRGEDACLELLQRMLAYIRRHGCMPPKRGDAWRGRAVTRKEFEQFLILDPSDPDAFERKIRACRHSRFAGPFVEVNGHLFTYHAPKPD